MALRWENLASTTHSLTPRTENRPLFFGILTPGKKPGATGSAGRCERGVGRFTDPHPLTCSFFTPSLRCFMFGLCEWPLRALLGLLFPFLPFICPPVLSPAWMGWLSPIPFRRCPGFAHNWPTRLQQGWSGASLVSFLYPVLKLAKNRRTGGSLVFLPKTSLPLPLKGEGLGIACLGFVGFAPLVHNRVTLAQQGRSGPLLVSFPYPVP